MTSFRCKLNLDIHGREAFKEGLYYSEDIVLTDDDRTALVDGYGILHLIDNDTIDKHFVEEEYETSPGFQRLVWIAFGIGALALMYYGIQRVIDIYSNTNQ
jgi:hypothetical protein